MAELLEQHSALAHLGLVAQATRARSESQGVAMSELPYRAAVNLRGRLDEPGFAAAVDAGLGCLLPDRVGGVATSDTASALMLGPDEWLLVAEDGTEGPALRERLAKALDDYFCSVVEVGQQYCWIRLAGPEAAATLQKGCPLDLDPAVFAAGHCAQSLLSKIDVLVCRRDDRDGAPVFEVAVRRSFADYAWRWLHDAAREYGVAVVAA